MIAAALVILILLVLLFTGLGVVITKLFFAGLFVAIIFLAIVGGLYIARR